MCPGKPLDPTCPEFEAKTTPIPPLPERCSLLHEGIFHRMKLYSLEPQVVIFIPDPNPRIGLPRAVFTWGPYVEGKYCCAEGWNSLDASKRVVGLAADIIWGKELTVSKNYFVWEMSLGLQNIFEAMIRGERFPTASVFFRSPDEEKS